jgi:cytochrome b pre-mRNA-processing protein 3
MIALHVHLLCRRLGPLGASGARLAQDLFDVMFRDLDRNLREMGVGDPSVPKRIRRMTEAYYGRARALDEARSQGATAVAAVLARNVLGGASSGHAGELAAFVGRIETALAGADPADLLAGNFAFPSAD